MIHLQQPLVVTSSGDLVGLANCGASIADLRWVGGWVGHRVGGRHDIQRLTECGYDSVPQLDIRCHGMDGDAMGVTGAAL
jgi:hypothetical protein